MNKGIDYYRCKFSKKSKFNKIGLNISRAAGEALNKPVLLFTLIKLIEREQIQQNRIELSPKLIANFVKLWEELEIEQHKPNKPNIGSPFFHLRSEGFWHFKAYPGYEFIQSNQSNIKVNTVNALTEAVEYAYLDDELFQLLQNPTSRSELTIVLLSSYFSGKIEILERFMQVDEFDKLKQRLLAKGGEIYRSSIKDEQGKIVRDGAFRENIISIYKSRCAFCHLEVSNISKNIIDAAHIKPFSKFCDNRNNNGISLCKNHHWAFDRYCFTIENDYTILISKNLLERSPHATPMREFQGKKILLPNNEDNYPRLEALAWHRQAFENELQSNLIIHVN